MAYRFPRTLGRIGLGLISGFALTQAACAADTITLTKEPFSNGSVGGTIWAYNPATWADVSIGRFALTGTDTTTNKAVSWNSYCVDISQTLTNGAYTLQSIADTSLSGKAAQLNALIANGDAGVNSAVTSAAMQLAVWEIEYEGGSSWSFNSGNFGAYQSSADTSSMGTALSLANGYLTNVANGTWKADSSLNLSVLTSGTKQDQLVFQRTPAPSTSAVPEPASWAMMIGGFGMVGAGMRRRRTALAAA